ncbi:MAG: glycosyltransferase [Myxococcota bacterium]
MLILLDKYYSKWPEDGLSPVIYNQIPTLADAGLEIRHLFTDLFQSADEFEQAYTRLARQEGLVWISSVMSPWISRSLLRWTQRTGIRIVAVFWDAIRIMAPHKQYKIYEKHRWYHDKIHRARRVASYADVIVHFDWPLSAHPEKTIFFPTPQPRDIFFPTAENGKTIDVSFVGDTKKADRARYVESLPGIVTTGGRNQERIPLDRYAELIRVSRLSLNIVDVREGIDQLNGRSFEVAHSRTALLQPDGPSLRRFLEPGKEFIPLEGPDDLPKKVQYYLEHEVERAEIAARAWRRVTREYSAERLWEQIRSRL